MSTEDSSYNEKLIISKAKEDPAYFDILYDKYFDNIYIYFYKRTYNEALSGDLTSNTFYLAITNLHKYVDMGFPFSSWLYKIAANELNGYFRKNTKETRHISISDEHIDTLFSEIEENELTENADALIAKLFEQLSQEEIQLVELRFFEDRSYKEMGYLLNLTPDNAKVKTYRILGKLKKLINKINPF